MFINMKISTTQLKQLIESLVTTKMQQLHEKSPSKNRRSASVASKLSGQRKDPERTDRAAELANLVGDLSRKISEHVHGEDIDFDRDIEDGITHDLFAAVSKIIKKYKKHAYAIKSRNRL